MKRSLLSVLFLAFNIWLFGQTKEQKVYNVKQIQGIWQLYFNYTYPNPGDEASYTTFHIFKGRKCLDVDNTGSPLDKLSVVVSDYGFSNSYWRDTICVMKHLYDTGKVYVELDENADLKDCHLNIATIFELNEKSYLNIFSDECNYLEKAPKKVLEVLFKRGEHDNRDYIKEFLDLQVCGIKVEKNFIYDNAYKKTKGF